MAITLPAPTAGNAVDMGGLDLWVNNVYTGTTKPQQVGSTSPNNFLESYAYNVSNSAVSFTATAALITGASQEVTLYLTGAPGGAANITLPTVASTLALTSAAIGSSYYLTIVNVGNTGAWTLLAGTGWTVQTGAGSGVVTIAQNTSRTFLINVVSATAMTATSLYTASWS